MAHHKVSFLAVGPQKTGTTWLYQKMVADENLCFPKNVKETMFFDVFYDKGISRYLSYFAHCLPHQMCGEIAPSYFDCKEVPKHIYHFNSNCKIIITLRSPILRTFSLYCHHLKKGRVPNDFQAATQKMPRILESGCYAKHIPIWLDTFGSENILFILMDDIIASPEKVLAHVYSFLELPTNYLTSVSALAGKVNQASMPRFPMLAKWSAVVSAQLRAYRLDGIVELAKKMGLNQVYAGADTKLPTITPAEASYLNDYYDQDIKYVQDLLKRPLPNWLAQT